MFVNSICIWYNKNMDKNMFNINNNELSYGRGYVYSLQYHLVWCTKYRKKVLKDGIDAECKEMLCDLAEEYKFQILAMEVMPDHIHLLVDCRPQFYISDMIKIMKGNSPADVSCASRTEEGALGRASVESILLCRNSE